MPLSISEYMHMYGSTMIAKALSKNLEVKFSLSELEFRCKNLFLIWEKHWEARI